MSPLGRGRGCCRERRKKENRSSGRNCARMPQLSITGVAAVSFGSCRSGAALGRLRDWAWCVVSQSRGCELGDVGGKCRAPPLLALCDLFGAVCCQPQLQCGGPWQPSRCSPTMRTGAASRRPTALVPRLRKCPVRCPSMVHHSPLSARIISSHAALWALQPSLSLPLITWLPR